MKYNLTKRSESSHGKVAFILMVLVLVVLGTLSWLLNPPGFVACSGDKTNPQCICPSDQRYIGKRNIIFVDVTDPLAAGKIEDVRRLITELALDEVDLLQWLRSGKKIEKTSVYLLSDKKPSAMEPILSICSLPPRITWLFSELSESQEVKIKANAYGSVQRAIDKIVSQSSVTLSYIVEGLAVSTANASDWTPGGKLVLVSDLFENSPTCGFFEREKIPDFSRIGPGCEQNVNLLGLNLTKNIGHRGVSTVAICQIHSKPLKEGLIAFWRNLFQSQLGYDVLLTCDPNEIKNRAIGRG